MGRKSTFPSSRRSAVPSANGSLPHSLRSVSQYGDYQMEGMFHSKFSNGVIIFTFDLDQLKTRSRPHFASTTYSRLTKAISLALLSDNISEQYKS